ncbi:ribonuclease HI family protein [uncultured Granulicatella sp.]|uniref:ribonuclease HI family protein n=1 Tax=uncultured Granulicatella sp. TaxID=316089 RepID=UPI0028D1CD71|nr:ribonuclease HI family protein [uncultured Granulicatella sp.]
MIRVRTDAAVNGNPGKVGIGIEILHQKQQFLFKENSDQLMDNHQAELWAIYRALLILQEKEWHHEVIFLNSDSKFAMMAIEKNYTKQVAYQEILKKVQGERKKFPRLFLEWIPEKENRGADQLARQALQQILGR